MGATALVTSGLIVMFLAGFIVVTLLLLAPIFVLLSPILIPLGALLFVIVLGLLSAIFFGLYLVFGAKWLYNYVNGRRPPRSDQIDYAVYEGY